METNRGEMEAYANTQESEIKYENPGIIEVLKYLKEQFLKQETK